MNAKLFSYPLTIKEMHLDTFGHVNNASYLALLEEARWELLTQNGYGFEKIQQTKIGPTILEISIRFMKELCNRDHIIIESQMISYKNKIGRLRQKIIRNGDVCTEAEIVLALFDLSERKLILPTAEWLRAVGME